MLRRHLGKAVGRGPHPQVFNRRVSPCPPEHRQPSGPPEPEQGPTGKLTLNVVEAAEAFGISRSMIYQLIGSGQLPSIRIGGRRLVPVSALRDFVANQCDG
jgi:excisionase family DNA binding protein